MDKGFNIENLVRENVRRLQPYASARDEFTDVERDMIFLDANENPFENGVNRYPDPQQRSLKSILAEQRRVGNNQILLGNGSDEVLDLIFRAFCEPHKDNIITVPPTYGMYKVLADTNAVQNREVYLDAGYQPQVNRILDVMDNCTKILFLCSPNNPTANSFGSDRILEVLQKFNGLVVIDEAYIDFSLSKSWLNRLGEFPNLIVTQTLSKAYGMAGIRLGICYASSEIIAILNKIKPPYNVNELTQQKARERVMDQEKVAKEIDLILGERVRLTKELEKISFMETVYPSDANFILVKVDDANKRYHELLGKGIVSRNRSKQPLCENTLRFTVGTVKENNKLIGALNELSNG